MMNEKVGGQKGGPRTALLGEGDLVNSDAAAAKSPNQGRPQRLEQAVVGETRTPDRAASSRSESDSTRTPSNTDKKEPTRGVGV